MMKEGRKKERKEGRDVALSKEMRNGSPVAVPWQSYELVIHHAFAFGNPCPLRLLYDSRSPLGDLFRTVYFRC